MNSFSKINTFLIILLSIFAVFGFVNAQSDDLSGYAWSENIGWIKFNNESPAYAVSVDSATGTFSGYAWSENIGWISFNEADLSGCDSGNCRAELDFDTKEVSGWARALATTTGWDGWIKLKGADPAYGVTWNSSTQELEGYAWADGVIGWISFNCIDTDACGDSDYKVTTDITEDSNPPTVSIIAAPEGVTATWQNTNATATISCSDAETGCATSTYAFKYYTSDPGTCTSTYSAYTTSSPYIVSDNYWMCGVAKDLRSNIGTSTPLEFLVDEDEPSSQITSPDSGTWHSSSTDIAVGITDTDLDSGIDTDACTYRVYSDLDDDERGYESRVCNSTTSISVGPAGYCRDQGEEMCYVYATSTDIAGNVHSPTEEKGSIRYYNIDWTPPIVGDITTSTAEQYEEQTFSASLTDPSGNIGVCWLFIRQGSESSSTSTDVTFLPSPCGGGENCTVSATHTFYETGNYYLHFKCRDSAKNYGEGDEVMVTVEENSNPDRPVITSLSHYYAHCDTPEEECTNQFSCCVNPTTQTNCCIKFNVSAFDPNEDELDYSWDFGDDSGSTEEDPSHHYTDADTYNATVTVSDGTNERARATQIVVSNPSLSAVLTANPCFSPAPPLNGVDLRSIVAGTMFGTIDYKFDCTNNDSWDVEVFAATTTDYTATDACNYAATSTYTAKTQVGRGTATTTDTIEIKVMEETCTPDEETSCISPQGCSHTIVCQGDGTWPSCPTDTCTIGSTQDCGDSGGTQTCSDSCVWGECTDEGECSSDSDCSCPPDTCSVPDYYDYPDFGSCVSYSCSIGSGSGEPCEPTISYNDARCNTSPTSTIGCDNSGCTPGSSCGENWIAYNGNCTFNLLNQSTDAESNIVTSTWSIFYESNDSLYGEPTVCTNDTGGALCDFTLPTTLLPVSESYYVTLLVEDTGELSDLSTSSDFYLRQEAVAEFKCSLISDPGENWQNCENFEVPEGSMLYLEDESSASEDSELSTWTWTFEDGTPATSTSQNPSVKFTLVDSDTGLIDLGIEDVVGRTDSVNYQVNVTIPLPEWQEAPPI